MYCGNKKYVESRPSITDGSVSCVRGKQVMVTARNYKGSAVGGL